MTSERRWRPGYPLDVHAVLAPLRRGAGDPAFRTEPAGEVLLARNTPHGPALQRIAQAGGEVAVRASGPGADWCLETVPALLGAGDDDSAFTAHHGPVAEARKRLPGLRLGATGHLWDVLLAAILEQLVTGYEARRSWRELARGHGTPLGERMHTAPAPATVRGLRDWEWHRCGVDGARRRAIQRAAVVADRLEQAVRLRGAPGRALLCKVPGIGVWTAAEVAQRAWGDPDAVSFGDFHIPNVIGHALLGHDLDDDGLAELLEPYAPQRHRVVRYLEAAGWRRPRFGPRSPARNYRDR
ncbi:DNA-3-methyladenine glycosylase family protein [Sciscionella marina]|uniref:DNA-3-methyladenine glycosylase family protein n=1 Tax=Sciscionella marina TaxID=508770 RepID=UPI00036E4899|nr:hypothetical protein [Sciscionella marina]